MLIACRRASLDGFHNAAAEFAVADLGLVISGVHA